MIIAASLGKKRLHLLSYFLSRPILFPQSKARVSPVNMETHFTYKLEDLGNLEFPGTPLAVIGHPIKHSVSPAMHNAAIAKLRPSNSRFNDWAYYRFDIAPDDFAEALSLIHI